MQHSCSCVCSQLQLDWDQQCVLLTYLCHLMMTGLPAVTPMAWPPPSMPTCTQQAPQLRTIFRLTSPALLPSRGEVITLTSTLNCFPTLHNSQVVPMQRHPRRPRFRSLCFCRCDCPDQKTINTTWPGVPVLPDDLVSNYGVEMTGEFLVQRPQDGVTGETAAIFPTASDYHLVCLQHDGSAGV